MSTEGNIKIVSKYKNWSTLPQETVKDYIKTVDNESHRRVDPWHFLVGKDGLFDIPRQRYVHDVVKEFPHPNLYLRRVEDKVIEDLDDWSNFGDTDYAIWGSAMFPGEYDANKLEIVKKIYTFGDMKPMTMNAVIVFDGNREDFLHVIHQIFPELEGITDPEEIRAQVIFRDSLDIDRILEIVKPYLPKEEPPPPISEETVSYLAGLAYQGFDQNYIAREMQRLGAIGKHSFGCDTENQGLAGIMEQSSNKLFPDFKCPRCGGLIKSGEGTTTCPHCGLTKEQAGSTCG